MDWAPAEGGKTKPTIDLNEDRATILYFLDTYNKHLFEIEKHSVRKVRDKLDQFSKALVNPQNPDSDKLLFQIRQFFSSYRIDEYSYIQNTFDDFKRIIWDFADQLSEDIEQEKTSDDEVKVSLEQLREAVEANSIETLRAKSREFINFYVERQSKKDERRTKRLSSIRKNLNSVKKQLVEANQNMMVDHLTSAYNRKSFDEQLKKYTQLAELSQNSVSLILLDIDYFKKINDSYGHDIGDFVLKECVRLLQEIFHRDEDFVARIGGEEFAIILPDFKIEHAVKKAEETLAKISKEVFVQGDMQISFTVSMGIAELLKKETPEKWLKRVDSALYQSKSGGRNRFTVALHPAPDSKVA